MRRLPKCRSRLGGIMVKVKGYDCWFQGREARGEGVSAPDKITACLENVVCAETGLVALNAAAELKAVLSLCFGIVQRGTGGKKTLLGTIDQLNAEEGLSLPAQPREGFLLRSTPNAVIVAGADEAGLLYGVYALIRLLALKRFTIGTEISDAPVSRLRVINHWDNLDGSVERGYAGQSLFFNNDQVDFDAERMKDYARLLASVGVNRLCINNVNVRGAAKKLISAEFLPHVAALANIFRPFGIRIMMSINFGSPYADIGTADPLDEKVSAWWRDRAALVYAAVPDLAGFVVKADSEYEPGPFQYGRNHADGANMLARAIAPYGGELVWRCFVYNCTQDWRDASVDRARAAFDTFKPLDGLFDSNVVLQIKHGPYDFQVREPLSPLFGALEHTRYMMELQVTQEYTGHQKDLCFLPFMWEQVLQFDTGYGDTTGTKHSVGALLSAGRVDGLAGVGNTGLDANWTGHTLAQANLYGYGRLAWNPAFSAKEIAREWSLLTFPDTSVAEIAAELLLASYPAYEKYNAPFGICFMVERDHHYGPSVEGYEFSKWGTYHRADHTAIGIDRTPSGTGFTSQYAPKTAALFADISTCPEELLLFFHRVPYTYTMKNGKTLLQNIYDTHFEGYEEAARIVKTWKSLEDRLPPEFFESVEARMEMQLENARQWRDVINTYFFRHTGVPDEKGRKIYP